ncbi:1808_t:CDS:2 [Ambispora leptoticha]|uniref:1808_t:CDS:1 n=1 Tax=Ambispora leptoticha TaxID=144679 RepID=A0A9N9FB56_9GLOM|nr:1808_t:CDS:2 [Ambispora leptoticha]
MNQVASNIKNNFDKSTVDSISDEDYSQYEILRPPFPLRITVEDLLKKNDHKNRQTLKTVNSFFIYRKAMVMQNEKGKKCDMPKLSRIASKFWKQEPPHIKNAYKKLAEDAQELFSKQFGLLRSIKAGKSSFTVSGVAGPFTIWTMPDKENKISYAPQEKPNNLANNGELIGTR